MSEFTEDAMVNRLIRYHTEEAWGPGLNRTECHPEAHYNHYGDRGAVDLWSREYYEQSMVDTVYEVKSDAAIREATGANEILRQWNRSREYFYKHESRVPPRRVQFVLQFMPTALSLNHLAENVEMYAAAQNKTLCTDVKESAAQVFIRDPEGEMPPAPIVIEGEKIGTEKYGSSIEDSSNEIYQRVYEVLYD